MDGRNEQRVAIKFCFKAGLSATETLELVQKAYGNEALNRSNVFRWYSQFWNGRELVEDDIERWPSKIDSNWRTHCSCCWSGQKWPSNHIKNDSRIFEHLQDCSSLDSERGFGKEKVVCMFCSTLLDTWAKRRSSHTLPRHYCNGWCGKNFFNKLLLEMRPSVLPMTRKKKQQSSEWVGETSPRPKRLKFQRSHIKTMLIICFDSQGTVHKNSYQREKQ